MAWSGQENFGSGTVGNDLHGSSGGSGWATNWSGDTDWDFSSTAAHGYRGVECLSTGTGDIVRTTSDTGDATVYVAIRRSLITGSLLQLYFYDGATFMGQIGFGTISASDQIAAHDGGSWNTALSSPSTDTWYSLKIDFVASSNTYTVGVWNGSNYTTNSTGSISTPASFSNVDQITLSSPAITSNGNSYVDSICNSDIEDGGCAEPATTSTTSTSTSTTTSNTSTSSSTSTTTSNTSTSSSTSTTTSNTSTSSSTSTTTGNTSTSSSTSTTTSGTSTSSTTSTSSSTTSSTSTTTSATSTSSTTSSTSTSTSTTSSTSTSTSTTSSSSTSTSSSTTSSTSTTTSATSTTSSSSTSTSTSTTTSATSTSSSTSTSSTTSSSTSSTTTAVPFIVPELKIKRITPIMRIRRNDEIV